MQADKKKLMILAAVAVALLGVGVFHMTSGSAPAPAPVTPKKTVARNEPTDTPKIGEVVKADPNLTGAPTQEKPAGEKSLTADKPGEKVASKSTTAPVSEVDLPERDPFDGHKYAQALQQPATPKGPTPQPAPTPHVPTNLKPLQVGEFGSAPFPGPGIGPTGGPALPPPAPDIFKYSVSGVITGDRPAAVFVDSTGKQQLVQINGEVGGDAKVVSISRGRVTVLYHGKKLTLSVGANTPAEKRPDEK